MNASEGSNMSTVVCQAATVGNASNLDGIMRVCEPAIGHTSLDMVISALRSIWARSSGCSGPSPGPCPRPSPLTCPWPSRMSPLYMYTNLAVTEAVLHSSNSSFRMNYYAPLEPADRHYGLYGLNYDNTVLLLGADCGAANAANVVARSPAMWTSGFLDACFTPQSKSAGRVRTLFAGVSIRIMTMPEQRAHFSLLSRIANYIYSIPATSSQTERVFWGPEYALKSEV